MLKKKNLLFLICLVLLLNITGIIQAAEFIPRTGGAYYNYGEALQKAIFFYKAQRSGDLPEGYPLIWRGDSALEDGADVGLDLTGGWYDAGDHIKFNLPMAYTAAQLGWAVYEYRDALEQAGQLDILLDEIKWTTDYLIKCHPEPNVYYYQCGYGDSDHGVWNPPEVIHLTTERTSFKVDTSTPGSDAAGQAAAALAVASIIFMETDPGYAELCLTHSKELFEFANTYRGKYPLDELYPSGSYLDDIGWAGVWLYLKTGDDYYLDIAESVLDPEALGGGHTQCWDDVSYGAVLLIAKHTGNSAYINIVERNLDHWMPGMMTYTPGGLAHLDSWGVLRYASGAAFLAFLWAETDAGDASKKETYKQFAESQINYILGDNPREGSYVVGYGENSPQHPHHRTAHGSWCSMPSVPDYHRHTLYGALVGGPDTSDVHNDDITDYCLNEVACDYNAAFVGTLAKMYSMYGGDPIQDFPQESDFRPVEDRLTEYFARGWVDFEGPQSSNVLIQVNNRSAWPAAVKDKLSARYFFDLSEYIDAGESIDNVQLSVQENEGAVMSELQHWYGNVYCVVLDFTGTSIYPGEWNLCEKDIKFQIQHGGTIWDPENDWSYQNIEKEPDYDTISFLGMTEYIPVYDDGILLWGEEPPRTGDTESPAVPSGINISTINSSRLSLSWNKNTELDLAGYNVYRGSTSGFTPSSSNLIAELKTTEYEDSGLNYSTAYYYKITAIDTTGNESSNPQAYSGTTAGAPAKVTNLAATAVTSKRIDLTWDSNTDTYFDKYNIYRSTISGFTPSAANLVIAITANTYSDTGLVPDTNYYYIVTAVDTSGHESTASDIAAAKTLAPDVIPPSAPTNLAVTVTGTTTASLTWDANTEIDFEVYKIYRSTESGFTISSSVLIAETSSTEYIDSTLNGLTDYYYKITACDSSGNESEPGTEINITTLSEIQVEYLNNDPTDETPWIKPLIHIVSQTGTAIPLKDITIRYWFTRDNTSLSSQSFTLYTAQIQNPWGGSLNSAISSEFGECDYDDADTYLEISFTEDAGNLSGAGQYAMITGAFTNNSVYNESNDYSYMNVSELTINENITVYKNGSLIWGKEPGTDSSNNNDDDDDNNGDDDDDNNGTTDDVEITYGISNSWQDGFSGNIVIQNNSDTSINGWQLSFTFPGSQQITNLWGGEYTQTGSQVSVTNPSWNSLIPAGNSVTIGFTASYSGVNDDPSDFTLE